MYERKRWYFIVFLAVNLYLLDWNGDIDKLVYIFGIY